MKEAGGHEHRKQAVYSYSTLKVKAYVLKAIIYLRDDASFFIFVKAIAAM